MRRRSIQHIVALIALTGLAGCMQATRHSNTMLFGTNTSFGIKVGTDVSQVPSVQVGYNRQEAVVMPLVANTGATNDPSLLTPCNLSTPVTSSGTKEFVIHPCSLVAVNGKAMDSYSVLASFGAQFDANGSGAKGGLAQYFATGVAAQMLALSGGASVVATGDAAKFSAVNAPNAKETIEALYGKDTAFEVGRVQANAYSKFIARLGAKIELTSDALLKERMATFEAAVTSPYKVADACSEKVNCLAAANRGFAIAYDYNSAGYEAELLKWKTD